MGKLAKACTNACGIADYSRTESYDLYGRLSSTVITVDSTRYTTMTGYDSSGRLSTTTYPSGGVVSYTYHGDGYLAGITNGVGGPGLWTVAQRAAMAVAAPAIIVALARLAIRTARVLVSSRRALAASKAQPRSIAISTSHIVRKSSSHALGLTSCRSMKVGSSAR